MNATLRDRLLAAGFALIAFAFYAGFLSKAYVFEGLIRALPIETGRWVHLFAGNYLLYGPLGLTFHTFLRSIGFEHLAVTSLQILDACLGAGGIYLFYRLLRRLGNDALSSVSWTAVLGLSLGYWLWSTEAENYILSTLLLMTTFYFLVKAVRGDRVNPTVLGALHGLAILGHIVNVLFGAVVLWVLFCIHGRSWRSPVFRYAAAAAAVPLAAYTFVLAFVQKPASVREAWSWFKGSAGAAGSINLGGSFSLDKFWEWLKMSVHLFGSFQPAYSHPAAWPASQGFLGAAWLLLAILFLGVFFRFRDMVREERAIAGGCLLWLGVYALVFTRWEPWTMVYRVSDLIPLCVLLCLAHRAVSFKHPAWKAAPAALAVCLALGNLGAELYPRSFASNNPQLARMAFLKAHTREGDWIAGEGRSGEIHIPYFAQRYPLVIERFANDPERLAAWIDGLLAKGQSVYVPSSVLGLERWKVFFNRYRLIQKAQDAGGFTLYQVRRYHS